MDIQNRANNVLFMMSSRPVVFKLRHMYMKTSYMKHKIKKCLLLFNTLFCLKLISVIFDAEYRLAVT
jgi:hypothetical protein